MLSPLGVCGASKGAEQTALGIVEGTSDFLMGWTVEGSVHLIVTWAACLAG